MPDFRTLQYLLLITFCAEFLSYLFRHFEAEKQELYELTPCLNIKFRQVQTSFVFIREQVQLPFIQPLHVSFQIMLVGIMMNQVLWEIRSLITRLEEMFHFLERVLTRTASHTRSFTGLKNCFKSSPLKMFRK
jgi:hypothetical protein